MYITVYAIAEFEIFDFMNVCLHVNHSQTGLTNDWQMKTQTKHKETIASSSKHLPLFSKTRI